MDNFDIQKMLGSLDISSEQEEQFIQESEKVQKSVPCIVRVPKRRVWNENTQNHDVKSYRTYKVRKVGQKVMTKIQQLENEMFKLEHEVKEGTTLKRANYITKRRNKIPSEQSAYYILGNWALCVPFLHRIYSAILYRRNMEDMYYINATGINSSDTAFFLGYCQLLKQARNLITNSLRDESKRMQDRKVSAYQTLLEESSPQKVDSK